MRRKELEGFAKQFSIDEIEKALVAIFVRQNKLSIKNNELVKMFVSEADERAINIITTFCESKKYFLNLKNLERCFELLITEEERKINGMVYTPDFIVEYICNRAIEIKLYESPTQIERENITICDPACGSGAFLVKATEILSTNLKKNIVNVITENIFGVDISERSVKRTKLILSLLALMNGEDIKDIKFNIQKGDSLNYNWQDEFCNGGKFDIIIGNPPYVRIQNLEASVRSFLQENWGTARTGDIDLYIPFFELGLQLINQNGIVGYITPSSYFSSKAGKNLRRFLRKNHHIVEIIDFGDLQIFDDVTTYTAITFLDKDFDKNCFYYFKYEKLPTKILVKKEDFERIRFDNLDDDKWILLSDRDFQKVRAIENVGTPLKQLAQVNVGIATLADKLYLLDGDFVKAYNGATFKIEKEITKEILKVSILKSEEDIKNNRLRIIWPYKKLNGRTVPISESEMRDKFPCAYKYFLAIKPELNKRDKGKKNYIPWYSFGRSQGLETSFGIKLLTSTLNKKPNFILCEKEETTFCAGYSVKPYKKIDLQALKKILNSDVMNYYIQKTSRPYRDGYKSFAKAFIENFSIPKFTDQELEYIKAEDDNKKLNKFLFKKYLSGVSLYSIKEEQLTLFLREPRVKYLTC